MLVPVHNVGDFDAEIEGTPPEMEANAEEAPDFKEAEVEAFLMREEVRPEANTLQSMHLLASLIFC